MTIETKCEWCGSAGNQVVVSIPFDKYALPVSSIEVVKFKKCQTCGTFSRIDKPNDLVLSQLYGDSYTPYQDSPESTRSEKIIGHILNVAANRYLQKIYSQSHGLRLLDFSAGTLKFGVSRQKDGLSVTVSDISTRLQNDAAANNIDFLVASDTTLNAAASSRFNIIHAAHVLEHTSDMKQTVVDLIELIPPTGVLHVSYPNARSLLLKVSPTRCLSFFDPTHISMPPGNMLSEFIREKYPQTTIKRYQESNVSDVLRFLNDSYQIPNQRSLQGLFRLLSANFICLVSRILRQSEREHMVIIKHGD
jgi:2-polyprenyl-3-methyl-5-hydroxy-6-metoxy-1,4-benzoquinol methylase